jgi:hypothetical protein
VVPCDPNSQANERQRLKEIAVSLTEERLESWYRTGICDGIGRLSLRGWLHEVRQLPTATSPERLRTRHAARLLTTVRRILRCWRWIALARPAHRLQSPRTRTLHALSPGSRLGVFEVISIIGRGGMGEVYRARDTRLARFVALKMLPDAAASDLEWRTRLEREARALASLNHPNIAAIYGLEESRSAETSRASGAAIVMDLVDGETLADRF